jgi:hypothetical protein
MKKSTFFIVLLLSVTRIFAQGEFMIELDPQTGTFVKNGGQIPGINWVFANTRTYDEVNGRMIFQGGLPSPDHLYAVDAVTGTTANSPAFPVIFTSGSVSAPQFDNANGTLYCLNHLTTGYYLATVDQVTGMHTPIGVDAVQSLAGLSLGTTTYDEINHRYILFYTNSLYTLNTVDGSTTYYVTMNLLPGDALACISYNNTNDTLYGLKYQSSSQLYFLVWIDPATGIITEMGSGAAIAAGNAGSTIDEANRRFIFSYSDSIGYHLVVMDQVTGDVLFNNQVILEPQDNIINIEYDNAKQKLFGIHWDALIDPSGVVDTHSESVQLYPNPASEELLVHFAKNYQDMHVSLYNVTGQQVRSSDFKQATECTFQLHDLSSGVYFLKFDTQDESFSAQFIKQ